MNDRIMNDRIMNDRIMNDRIMNDRIMNDRIMNDRIMNDRMKNDVASFLRTAGEHYAHGQYLLSGLHAEAASFLAATSPITIGDVTEVTALFKEQLPRLHPLAYYQALVEKAKECALAARRNAHAPFSNFLVGATLIAEDETLFAGCNVESSSYGLTICAERTALVSGVAHGYKRFVGVVVAADTPVLTPPCGACRQMLYDFAPDAVVVLVNLDGIEKRFTMRELLPEAFSVDFLR
jgi:cytidine deaminase